MNQTRIIFWQEHPSPHQAPWIRSLAQCAPGLEIMGVFQRQLTDERRSLGWLQPDYGNVQVILSPDPTVVDELLKPHREKTFHVFSGIVHNKNIFTAFNKALASRSLVGLLSEGRDWRGCKGLLRRVHSLNYEYRYRKSVDFVLAIGRVGINWFRRCGYDSEKMFTFPYVVERPEDPVSCRNTSAEVQIVTVSRLLSWKRNDLLIKALHKVSETNWKLKIVGDGPERTDLEHLVERSGLSGKVSFTGAISNSLVRRELQEADVFVFASHSDGWGAVVNEALMSGVPVICSDFCGAADLIISGFNGDLFQSDSLESLAGVLGKWISDGHLKPSRRSTIMNWSNCIEGEVVAKYFLEIINYLDHRSMVRPTVPWNATLRTNNGTISE